MHNFRTYSLVGSNEYECVVWIIASQSKYGRLQTLLAAWEVNESDEFGGHLTDLLLVTHHTVVHGLKQNKNNLKL